MWRAGRPFGTRELGPRRRELGERPPGGRGLRRLGRLGLGIAALASLPALAEAQPADARPTNDYSVDLFRGPVLAPLRVTGLAGAYSGVAEGISGLPVNAASPAVRSVHAIDWVDWDLAASLSIPLPIAEPNDFDDSGERDASDEAFIYATGGAMAQVGPFGAGALVEVERYAIVPDGTATTTWIARYHGLVGVALADGQLALGAGVRGLTVGIDVPDAELTFAGVGPQVGLLVRPAAVPLRVGATLRAPADAGALGEGEPVGADGVRRLGGLVLPDRVVLPWELDVGAAVQLGPRPFFRSMASARERLEVARARARAKGAGEDELERVDGAMRASRLDEVRALPREHLLITTSLLMTGPAPRGVGLEAFLAQDRRGPPVPGTSGAELSFSPRVGLQVEPLPGWLQTRLGTYYEPERFGGTGRQHFTFGADLRVWSTRLWGFAPDGVSYAIVSAVDLAPRYESISLGLGVFR